MILTSELHAPKTAPTTSESNCSIHILFGQVQVLVKVDKETVTHI
jgi:hypothetical protein